ncbi:hypothetical protein [Plantactinospora mayteni]|uniref:hypothetical protein n=1 Tax=Plantactinospora mayteni TaxID=566021 RepID=UPI0031E7792B
MPHRARLWGTGLLLLGTAVATATARAWLRRRRPPAGHLRWPDDPTRGGRLGRPLPRHRRRPGAPGPVGGRRG